MDAGVARRTQRVAKWFFGLGFMLGGLDKFTNIITDWSGYVSPFFARFIPFSLDAFMYLVGGLEIIIGILILTKWTRIGFFIGAAWVLMIAIDLMTGGWYDIALRDVMIAVGLWISGRLTQAVE